MFEKIKNEDIDFLPRWREWRNFEQNNKSIALNVLFSSQNIEEEEEEEEITCVYKSEHNFKRENTIALLMIDDDDSENYYYFPVKSKKELYSYEWLTSKKEAISNGENFFQNTVNEALDYQRIKRDAQRISEIVPYIDHYNWKDIKFPSHKEDWKKFEQNNKTSALNILSVPHNKKEKSIAYKSKYNYKRKNQVILLMVTNGKKWHYLSVRSLSALLREITSNHHGDFYCLNCFHSYITPNKLKKHERVCNNHDYCCVDMPKEHEKIKYLPGEKSLKGLFIIYADLECLLKKSTILWK